MGDHARAGAGRRRLWEITDFRTGLEERGLEYVVQVKGATSAFAEQVMPETPDYPGRGRPPAARY